jgi:DNA-binding NtrC family response regulator
MDRDVLCIDDDPTILMLYRSVLAEYGYQVVIALDGGHGLDLLARHSFDVVVVDYKMPGMDGEAVIREISKRELNIPVILISGSDSIPKEVMSSIQGFLQKPFTIQRLLLSLQAVMATPKKGSGEILPSSQDVDIAAHQRSR